MAELSSQSFIIAAWSVAQAPTGPNSNRFNKLGGIQTHHLDHSKTSAPLSGFIARIELTLGFAWSARNSSRQIASTRRVSPWRTRTLPLAPVAKSIEACRHTATAVGLLASQAGSAMPLDAKVDSRVTPPCCAAHLAALSDPPLPIPDQKTAPSAPVAKLFAAATPSGDARIAAAAASPSADGSLVLAPGGRQPDLGGVGDGISQGVMYIPRVSVSTPGFPTSATRGRDRPRAR